MANLNRVIILAGGKAKRYMGLPKQLIDICGEPLIHRIIRQVKDRGGYPIIATDSKEITESVYKLNVGFFKPDKGTTQKGWYSTHPLWRGRVIIILGDVILSKDAADKIFNSTGLCYFGSKWQGEIFSYVYDPDHYGLIKESLVNTNFDDWKHYRYMIGMPLEIPAYEDEIFKDIDDYTTDIDYPLEYKLFLEKVVNTGLIDDSAVKLKYPPEYLNRIPTEGMPRFSHLKLIHLSA